MRKFGLAILSFVTLISVASAQQKRTLDKIAGVVGSGIILESDIELKYASYLAQGNSPNADIKCQILQSLLTQKLLAQQAVIDSIDVKDDEVDADVDRRMRGMIQRAGGQDRLEQFLGRSVIQYKDEIRPDIRESLVARKMQEKITSNVNTTPLDVQNFFTKIPKDSLPTFNKEVEVGEIQFNPKLTPEEKEAYRQKAEELRARIIKGEDFGALARLYSQDPGSAPEGGDLGFNDRTAFVKEFTAMAFKLKAGEISPVFESDYGFHFLQVIERRGEQVHVRHILIVPAVTQASLDRAKAKADSVYDLLGKNKKIDFSSAAAYYSDNKDTKYNGGMLLNADNVETRTTYIPTDRLDPQVALTTDTMKVGSLSVPQLFTGQDGKKTYKILFLKSTTPAHKANLTQDYPKIKEYATNDKINRTVSEWFQKRRKETFIKIDPEYQQCSQLKGWSTPQTTAEVKP
ncbi:periplasmic chaperone for outer membrane proteins SurA [Mucilaginibacter frigoritolerans]|uniref:Periplasmic chaperone for outer membrane proteins SurA n=1 Tax=Mucilaginibacter frigoritolerans TaxID=652788 RepID=A0A562U0K1_9SPHI|nr:peptidylprolyl isomerase [Mucilaginibacter frigoritolerans]TWI99365.1 periplasmic chaperone for outer membrane proteins SurA [Mucilaginibacter frigoritolerans]